MRNKEPQPTRVICGHRRTRATKEEEHESKRTRKEKRRVEARIKKSKQPKEPRRFKEVLTLKERRTYKRRICSEPHTHPELLPTDKSLYDILQPLPHVSDGIHFKDLHANSRATYINSRESPPDT